MIRLLFAAFLITAAGAAGAATIASWGGNILQTLYVLGTGTSVTDCLGTGTSTTDCLAVQ